jgi:carbamoyltransferase
VAALLIDGTLVAAAEEERFNRVKHCVGFPELAAAWGLADDGLEPGDLDHISPSRATRRRTSAAEAMAHGRPVVAGALETEWGKVPPTIERLLRCAPRAGGATASCGRVF